MVSPDLPELAFARVTADLPTRSFGRRYTYFSEVSSTMDVAREQARAGFAEGSVVSADRQLAGRGRMQRSWLNESGTALQVSIILRPRPEWLGRLTMVSALAVADAIDQTTSLAVQLKWPNDVLIAGRKTCGILLESEFSGGSLNFVILGIGLNVNLDVARYPELAESATSLMAALGRPISRLDLLRALLVHLERRYDALRAGEPVHLAWRSRLATLGQSVRVSGPGMETPIEGVAEDVDENGSLLVRQADGSLATVVAGDVTLRR